MSRSIALLVLGTLLGLAPATARGQGQGCFYRGSQYSDGSLSCQRGVQEQCLNGDWVDQGNSCAEDSGGAGGEMQMDSGAEQPKPTGDFMPGDSQVAPPMPDDQP